MRRGEAPEVSLAAEAGPLAGAAIAVGVAFVLRGAGGGRSGSEAAQGALYTEVKRSERP